jgi:hypothetical protein
MEKLIELLNEYEKIAPSRLQRKYYSESWHIMYIDEEWEDVDDYRTDYEIISKDYGFIKRLVDNDKIDFSREWEYCTKSIEEFDWLLRDDEDWLIMILAISDTPVDDLISYLK